MKFITQRVSNNGCFKRLQTRCKNYTTDNTTVFDNQVTRNGLQKISTSRTVDRTTGNLLLTRDINAHRHLGTLSDLTKYNPNDPQQFIRYLKSTIGHKAESRVIGNGWEGINPGPYSNWHIETTAEHINATSAVNLSQLGFIS